MHTDRDNYPEMSRDNYRLISIRNAGYYSLMMMSFADALAEALYVTGISLKKLSESAGVSYEQMKKVRQGKSGSTNVDDAAKIAAALNMTLDAFLNGDHVSRSTIPVPGHVGAGDQVDMVNPYAEGDGMYHVTCPPQLSPHDVVALEVRGQSMEPTYLDGGLIFYSRGALAVPTEALGRICVAEDEKENIWLKQVKPGSTPGLFHLISINPTSLNLHDIRLTWASPIRFYLPPDMVERLERG